MLSNDIRKKFLEYFQAQGHTCLPSSPVVPFDDPTLLFINAGMNQFKDVFLGQSTREEKRATTSQKCIRVGGKHNDLENVGHTSRHLTFFEMLGNFSFGDYFKEEAIKFSWDVSTTIFGFDPIHLWASVYLDDDEAFEIWTQYIPPERIVRFGESENYWSMGDTGPCGPCSELYYDRGIDFGGSASLQEDPDSDRYVEFWNLVFMQDNRLPSGEVMPLPNPSIDTGAGLERIIALMMQVDSVFETDLLNSIISQIEQITKKKYDLSRHNEASAFRVIADHLRCLSFAIADGVQPSNVDRGYVLRKVLRRAVRYGRVLGQEKPFLAKITPHLVKLMGNHFPELKKNQERITEILTVEEENFFRTLKKGGNLLSQVIERAQEHGNTVSGDDAFTLKDTYGFPIDETELIAKDSGLVVDRSRFEELEEEARERSRKVHKKTEQFANASIYVDFLKSNPSTKFVGYDSLSSSAFIQGCLKEGTFVDSLEEGDEGIIILDQTPFYAEMGGQVGDTGMLTSSSGTFKVTDTTSPYPGITAHIGTMKQGILKREDKIEAKVEKARRKKIANNHTATHLLHWALHEVLGEHIKQAGSVVDPTRLRFDFSHHKALTEKEIRDIEDLVNEMIRRNEAVSKYEIPYSEAQTRGDIKQFFGDKYGSVVRVIDIPPTKELCGGTHTSHSGNIGLFKIASEKSIAAGIRRIEAVTGQEAENLAREPEDMLQHLAKLLKTTPQKLEGRLGKLLEDMDQMQQEVKQLNKMTRKKMIQDLLAKQENINSVISILEEVIVEGKELRTLADETFDQMQSGVLVLACRSKDKVNIIVRVSDDLIQKGIKANELIQKISPLIDGGGGGKADSAQAGGKKPENIQQALATIKQIL